MMDAIELRNVSHCPLAMCKKAIEYAEEHNGDDYMAIAYLKAKTLAVATPGLSFDERVRRFMGEK
jgi:translation elongation factor EF-Ts